MKSFSREFWVGLASALGVVVLWTTFHLVSRTGVRSALTPFDLSVLRFGIGALVLLPFAFRLGLGHLKFWQAAVLAAFAGPGFALFAFPGFVFAPVAHAGAILSGTVALFTALFGRLFLRDRLSRLQIGGLAALSAGVAFLIGDGFTEGPAGQWIGDLLFLIAAANWAVYGLLVRSWKVDALRGTMITAILTAIVYLPVHFAFLPSNLTAIPLTDLVVQAAYHGIFGMIVAMLLFTRAVVALGPALTSIIVASVPATSSVAGWFILGEALTGPTIGGVVLVTAGIIGAVFGAQKLRAATPQPAAAQTAGPAAGGMVESANNSIRKP